MTEKHDSPNGFPPAHQERLEQGREAGPPFFKKDSPSSSSSSKNTLIVGVGTLISRLLGFVRDAGIAWLLGGSGAADALTAALREYMGDKVDVLECGTGLHLLVRVRDGRSQDELVAAAAAADVAVYPTKKYWADPARATKGVVLVGFSSIAEADIRPGIAALARAWFG